MYDRDTFFNLSIPGQIGLAALSLILVFLMIWLIFTALKKTPRFNLPLDVLIRLGLAVSLFWLFVWLSPQIYYTYYHLLFDDLPRQIVVKTPPTPQDLANLLFFQNRVALSHHSTGILGWSLILIALANTFKRR